jgi:glycosyltransferase involved in cell wall biosynthesis
MKIAIASSGLGHIARGIETWAFSLAKALASEQGHRPELDITLFYAAHPNQPITLANAVGIRCVKRGTRWNRWLTKVGARFGGWRYGFGSIYETEQSTFAPGLIRALRVGRYDIVHLQDPWLAWVLEKARRVGFHPAQVILAHGTEETPEYLSRFKNIQELTPVMAERSRSVLSPQVAQASSLLSKPAGWKTTPPPQNRGTRVWMIPNSVDTERFVPAKSDAAGKASRRRLNLAPDIRIIGCVAALKAGHKRVDYLIDEFTRWSVMTPNPDLYALVLLGATTTETPALRVQIERSPARGRIRMLENMSYADMPDYYAAFDLHVLCSLFEVCPMAELEALACGVPCMGHDVGVNRWFFGETGWVGDLSKPGGLGKLLEAWSREGWERSEDRGQKTGGPEQVGGVGCSVEGETEASREGGGAGEEMHGAEGSGQRVQEAGRRSQETGDRIPVPHPLCPMPSALGSLDKQQPNNLATAPCAHKNRRIKARERAEAMFSPEAVIPQILEMYEEVLGRGEAEHRAESRAQRAQ